MDKSIRKLKFETAMERLDQIVAAMEAGEIGIEESIAKYEEAMRLAGHCRKILDQAEQRIKQIHLDAAGNVELSPFDPPADAPAADDDDDAGEPPA